MLQKIKNQKPQNSENSYCSTKITISILIYFFSGFYFYAVMQRCSPNVEV